MIIQEVPKVRQVVRISPNATLRTMEYKPSQGVNLKAHGVADVVRATDILWDDSKKGWYVMYLTGSRKGGMLTCDHLLDALYTDKENRADVLHLCRDLLAHGTEIAYFFDYDTAIRGELVVMNYLLKTEK